VTEKIYRRDVVARRLRPRVITIKRRGVMMANNIEKGV